VKITIVTLSFNQRDYLKEAIESIVGQYYPELEYIVVDPGSRDGSRELIEQFGSAVTIKVFEPDKGPADGLIKGFNLATGTVYGFINSDDALMPAALERVADFFECHPHHDLVVGDGYIVDGDGHPIRHVIARKFSVQRYLHGGADWLQQSTFFRASAYGRVGGFNPQNRTCWDGELFVNIVRTGGKVGYIHSNLAKFRIHSQSISGSQRLQTAYYEDRQRLFESIYKRKRNISDEAWSLLYRVERGILYAGRYVKDLFSDGEEAAG
jgi:glycosyltransferase involved in cell wall biosynthesis